MVVCPIAAVQSNSRNVHTVRDSGNVCTLRSPRHSASCVLVGVQHGVAGCARDHQQVGGRDTCVRQAI
eukprot:14715048-Alexandrium_andersonii.AAC.1